MNLRLLILSMLVSVSAFSQTVNTISIPVDKYAIVMDAEKDTVQKFDVPVRLRTINDVELVDSVIHINNDADLANIGSLPKPANERWGLLFNNGLTYHGSISLTEDNWFIGGYGRGDNPVIKGTKEATGWQQLPRNNTIYYTIIPGITETNRVLIDGTIATISQFPSASTLDPYDFWSGYVSLDSALNTGAFYSDTIVYYNQLPSVDLVGSRAVFRSVGWANYWQNIINMPNSYTLVLDYGIYSVHAGTPFFIVNNPDLIDGDKQYATRGDTLFIRVADPSNHTIEYSSTETAITITGKSNIKAKNLRLEGFNYSGVSILDSCENIVISDCDIDKCYHYGVRISDTRSNNITIKNNNVEYSSYQAIASNSSNSIIDNNRILKHGLRNNIGFDVYHPIPGNPVNNEGAGTGIISELSSNTIRKNYLDSIGYIGIFVKGLNNLVEYNQVYHCDLVLEDGAGFYSHLDCTGTIIRKNISAENGFPTSTNLTHGYYFDNTNQGLYLEDNIAYGNHGYGILLNNPGTDTIRRNVIYENMQAALKIDDYVSSYETFLNSLITDNIFFSKTDTSELYLNMGVPLDSAHRITIYNNYYCNPFISVGVPTDWDANPKTLYTLFDTDFVADTLGQLVPNNTFETSDNWYGTVVASSPIGTGGALIKVYTASYHLSQSFNLSYEVTQQSKMQLTFDIVGNTTGLNPIATSIGSEVSFPDYTFGSEVYHYEGFAEVNPMSITGRLQLGITNGVVGDTAWVDNVYVYNVLTDVVDQNAKSELFINNTNHSKIYYINGANANDIDGNNITISFVLSPFEAKILVGDNLNLISEMKL